MEFELEVPRVVHRMIFCNEEFIGVINCNGRILKFNSDDGYGDIWCVVGCLIDVLEWAVRLKKIESQTFAQFRLHLLRLHRMNKSENFYKNLKTTRTYLSFVMDLVDGYWDRLI